MNLRVSQRDVRAPPPSPADCIKWLAKSVGVHVDLRISMDFEQSNGAKLVALHVLFCSGDFSEKPPV